MNFAIVAMDQIINHAAKMRYMFGGQVNLPMTIRAAGGGGTQKGAQHSHSIESWFVNAPGHPGRDAAHAVRRQGPAQDRDPQRRRGALHRARDALHDEGRGAGRGVPAPVRCRRREAPRPRRHDRGLVEDGARGAARRGDAGGRGHRGRGASIRARSIRSTGTDLRLGRAHAPRVVVGGRLAHRRASARRSRRRSTRRSSTSSRRPCSAWRAADVPTPYASNLEKLALPRRAAHRRRRSQDHALGAEDTRCPSRSACRSSPTPWKRARLIAWRKKVGDPVKRGEVLPRSRPTRPTWSSRPTPRARSRRSWSRRARRCRSGRLIARAAPAGRGRGRGGRGEKLAARRSRAPRPRPRRRPPRRSAARVRSDDPRPRRRLRARAGSPRRCACSRAASSGPRVVGAARPGRRPRARHAARAPARRGEVDRSLRAHRHRPRRRDRGRATSRRYLDAARERRPARLPTATRATPAGAAHGRRARHRSRGA